MILVTGGAGFIGSELVRQLAARGNEVIVVDNLINGRRENLAGLPPEQVRLAVRDIRNSEDMAELMRGVNIVFHLACLGVRHSIHSPDENHEVNATATLKLLSLARSASVKRFVYVSTSEVYGTARRVPMTEEHPTLPMTVYGASKLAGEGYTRAFHQTHGYPTMVVRPFNTYGPRCHHEGDSGEVIPKFLLRSLVGRPVVVFGDGTQTRDFTYVSDTARGILMAGLADGVIGETINLGSGREIAVNDLAREVAGVVGLPSVATVHDEPRPGDVRRLCADVSKAHDLLGFAPEVTLREGLTRLRSWYLSLGRPLEELLELDVQRNWERPAGRDASETRPVIPVARPWMSEQESEAVRRPILSGWVTQGPEVEAFEKEFAAYVGARHACAVSSGTTALHLALLAAGVAPGDEVITVSHSFIATASSVRFCGATPVLVDVDPGTFNIDPALIERTVTQRTRAILCVHQMGMPCHLAVIVEIARRHSIAVVEDAACAIGSKVCCNGTWEMIGRPHGDIACFSFHPRKLLTTGDGGMITTANSEWDRRFRLWRQHGMSVPDRVRDRAREVIFESYVTLGYNYRMTDIQAAIGRVQLRRLTEVLQRRRYLAERYRKLLTDVPGVVPPEEPESVRSNWQSYCVRLPDGCGQRAVMQAMLDAGIATRRGIMCAHREPAYPRGTWSCGTSPGACECQPGSCARLSESERAQDGTIILPLSHQMTDAEQDAVVKALSDACAGQRERVVWRANRRP